MLKRHHFYSTFLLNEDIAHPARAPAAPAALFTIAFCAEFAVFGDPEPGIPRTLSTMAVSGFMQNGLIRITATTLKMKIPL
jgi:hypothetical protein